MKDRKIILFYPKPDKENSNMHLPLPVLAVASDLLKDGYSVEIIDERKEPDYRRQLRNKLEETALFGVSAMTGYQIEGGLNASHFVRSINKNIPIVWGGWHVSMLPEESLGSPYIDIGVIGPGEEALQQIYASTARNTSLSEVAGIIHKNGKGEIINSKKNNALDKLHTISKHALKLINVSDYVCNTELGSKSIFWVTSSGCPFNCGFCCSLKVYNRHWQGLEAEKILEDMQFLKKCYGINGMNFVDTNFFVDKERVVRLASGIIERKLDVQWAASVRVDQINLFDNEFLKLLKRSGCLKLFVGAESGSKEVLELIDKDINIEDIFKMARVLDKTGIIAEIFVMAGFPLDPQKDIHETLSLAKKIKEAYPNHQFTSFIYTPYPGTPLYGMALRNGLKVPNRIEEWSSWNMLEVMTPWIRTKGYSDRLHSFTKLYYPLAFPSDNLRKKFKDLKTGWIYWLLYKIESFRVKNNFFLLPLEWTMLKFINKLKTKSIFLKNLGGFR